MKRSANRILTTHVGSLVRPPQILAMVRGRAPGTPFTDAEYATVKDAVTDTVAMEAECGIDIPSDGEHSKFSFSGYVSDRLTGFETRPGSV